LKVHSIFFIEPEEPLTY